MKQETTIFNADYCFFSLKGRRVLGNQISCVSKNKGISVCCCACVGQWNHGMVFDVCGFN